MKDILITGVNSYVGNRLEKWLEQWPDKYNIHKISLRDGSWKEKNFSTYDSIVHVAGIAHQKETKENASSYYKVNRDLAHDIAVKAKNEKVEQFIFLSSMSVYGLTTGVIDENTPLKPNTHYGRSKLEAEKLIDELANDHFKVAIVRPPMIYGKDCPGNYQRLRSLALKTPVFPKINNKRSMIYIDNLSEFIRHLIDGEIDGLYLPQNKEYVCTSKIVQQIAEVHNKKMYLTRIFNPLINLFKVNITRKVFGDLIYKRNKTKFKHIKLPFNFNKSITYTEKEINEND